MLADRELATIRAALAFWRDEMTPHGTEAQRPYLEGAFDPPLNAAEVNRLRALFADDAVRYAAFVAPDRLTPIRRAEALAAASSGAPIVAVIGLR